MAIGIVENLRSSYDYTNKSLNSFTDWVILITITMLMLAGVVLVVLGILGMAVTSFTTVTPDAVTVTQVPLFDPVGATTVTGTETTVSGSFPLAELFGGAFSLVAMGIGAVLSLVFGILWTGFILRVYRGGELKLGSWGRMFLDGLLATIISLLYCIPYVIIYILLAFGPMINPTYALIALIVEFIVILITSMVLLMGLIRFAKEQRFGAAFQIKELFSIIGTIGWLRYLANIIVIGIIMLVISVILLLILGIGWVLLLVLVPFLSIWEAKFFANLYESALPAPAAVEE